MIDFLTTAELDKVLRAHRLRPPVSQYEKGERCLCGTQWPCWMYRMAEEVQRRRAKEATQEKMI